MNMKNCGRSVFLTLILSLILIGAPLSSILAQEKASTPERAGTREKTGATEKVGADEKKEVKESGLESKEKKPPSETKKEIGPKEEEAKEKAPLTTKSERSTIEDAFNERIPSFKNRLEREFKEKILTDRSLTPEETQTLRENLEDTLLKQFDAIFDKEISQFGYNIFDQPASPFTPAESAPVGPDYVLGPSDNVIVQLWGMTNESYNLILTREGYITLPKVGAVYLWGMNFSDAEKKIKEGLSRFYKDVHMYVSLGSLRSIKVSVLGAVKKPGLYTIGSLSTLLHSLYYAGGPTKLGSLRNIKLIRKGEKEKAFDLYQLLIHGDNKGDVRLLDNDTIFVPFIGSTVGITGDVKNPAIFEMTGREKLSDAMKMSGGLTSSAYLQKIQVNRILANKSATVIELEFSDIEDLDQSSQNIEMKDMDLILISSIEKKRRDYATIKGNVKRPGEYQLMPNMKVSDLISQAKGLLPETYMERGEILRFKSEYTRDIIPFEVSLALKKDPGHDLPLKEWDIVEIKSIFDIYPKPSVSIIGEVNKPGIYRLVPGMRISDLIYQARELKDTAFLERAELSRRNYGRSMLPETLIVNLEAVLRKEKEANLLLEKDDTLFIRPRTELTGNFSVVLDGEFKFPGTFAIKKGEKLGSVIERAGGFTSHAFLRGAVFTRKSLADKRKPIIDDFVSAQKRILLEKEAEVADSNYSLEGKEARRIALAKKNEALNLIAAKTFLGRIIIDLSNPESKDFLLEDGDSLIIPAEPQTVLIVGEVYNPETVAFTPGKGVDFYLNKVGGPTGRADRSNLYVIRPDGQVESRGTGFSEVTKGDTIVVPEKFD